MDEKLAVSRNALNRALAKQIDKREAAGTPSAEKASMQLVAVASAQGKEPEVDFFSLWEKWYPTVVSLLGWADFVLPGKAVKIIKALLAVVNNQLIPIAKEALK